MTHRETIRAVARRFPDLTQGQIEAVLDGFIAVWRSQLEQPDGDVTIRGFGTLAVECQHFSAAGVIRQQIGGDKPVVLARLYFRFRPTAALKAAVGQQVKESR